MFVYLQAEYVTGRNQLNQVSLLDNIILSKKRATLKWDVKQEYPFVDQGAYLRGRPVNLTLTWSIMPKVGAARLSITVQRHCKLFETLASSIPHESRCTIFGNMVPYDVEHFLPWPLFAMTHPGVNFMAIAAGAGLPHVCQPL
jgi:hypothetical protein